MNVKGVFDQATREHHMAHAMALELPRLKKERRRKDVLTIACYGPSLAHTWTQAKHPLLTVSGAHDFLIEGGIVPDYHVDIDPREHKSKFVENPHPDVRYLMASVCNPQTWENLLGRKVEIWHLIDGQETKDWCDKNDPTAIALGGGTTVGERALGVGAMLGFRRFEIHGMDCSFAKSGRHAGEHYNLDKEELFVKVNGEIFHTTGQLATAARDMLHFIVSHDIEVKFMGYGLMQALAKEAKSFRRAA